MFRSSIVFLRSSKKTLLMLMVVALLSVLLTNTVSILSSKTGNLTVPSLGTVKTVGVKAYWDADCTHVSEQIDWGTLLPGLSTNVTLYVRNISNVKTSLQLNAASLSPAGISDYLVVSWDYDGSPLEPGDVVQVTLFLSVPANESFISYLILNSVTDFNIDIQIMATEFSA